MHGSLAIIDGKWGGLGLDFSEASEQQWKSELKLDLQGVYKIREYVIFRHMVPTLLDFRGVSDTPLDMCENRGACGAQALPGPP